MTNRPPRQLAVSGRGDQTRRCDMSRQPSTYFLVSFAQDCDDVSIGVEVGRGDAQEDCCTFRRHPLLLLLARVYVIAEIC